MRLVRRLREPSFAERFPPPPGPTFGEVYGERHRALVSEALDDDGFVADLARRRRLPRGFGAGYDERVVEFPWLLAQRPCGRTLDAGSALNHAHVLDRVLPLVRSLHVVTLAPEPAAFPERGVSYVYADLRDLPYRDRYFDTVVSLSTLEHVGMDNRLYGVDEPRAADPEEELRRALTELRRVLAPRGLLLVTLPYGQAEDHGWFRQFDRGGIERLVEAVKPRRSVVTVFEHMRRGWRRSDLNRARYARYRDSTRDPSPAEDLAAAARAVACIRLEL